MSTWRRELGRRDFEKLVGTRFPELWLPVLNSFQLPAVLPGWLYVLRTRHARGAGSWKEAFGEDGNAEGSPRSVARRLLSTWYREPPPKASPEEEVLADWLAQSVLIVKQQRYLARRDRKNMGLLPFHGTLLRADLPKSWANTRQVPAWMALELSDGLDRDPVDGLGSRDSGILSAFSPGADFDQQKGISSDKLDLGKVRDPDQRLAASVAAALPRPPSQGSGDFARHARLTPLGSRKAWDLLGSFIDGFAPTLPSRIFVRQFMALTSAVLTREFLAHVDTVLLGWTTGTPQEQSPRVVVDLSEGRDRELVAAARRSFRTTADRLHQYMIPFSGLRMARRARSRSRSRAGATGPSNPTEAVRHLFGLAQALRRSEGLDPDAYRLEGVLKELVELLRDKAEAALPREQAEELVSILEEDESPLDALARAVVSRVGGSSHHGRARDFLRGCGGYNYPFGVLRGPVSHRSRSSAPFWRLSDDLLVAFAHLRTWRYDGQRWNRRPLSVAELVKDLEDTLGLAVRVPGDPEIARRNGALLRDRLSALGLFRSVSDAERMQRIQPTYAPEGVQR